MSHFEHLNLLNNMESVDSNNDDQYYFDTSKVDCHCHALLLSQKEEKNEEKSLRLVAALSAVFIITEFTGGYMASSLSIITDAGHMLSDFLSFIISIIMIRISRLPANKQASFGFLRAEVLGALMSILIIWVLTILLVVFATQRIISGKIELESDKMLITAILSVFFNIIMGIVLTCSSSSNFFHKCHSHYNSNSISPNSTCNNKLQNVNVRAAFIHIIGDFIQSLGVLCAAIIIKFTNWTLADPICTYLFSIIVFCTSFPVFKDIWRVLMEATPKNIVYSDIYNDLLNIQDVKKLHSLHIWTLNTRNLCASVHIVVSNKDQSDLITNKGTVLLQQKYGIMYTTIQVELENLVHNDDERFLQYCEYCKPFV